MKHYETDTDFSFAMEISKALAEVDHSGDTPSSKMYIKGVASNTRRDKQDQRFTRVGLEAIKTAIEEGIYDADGDWTQVPLRSGHRNEWDDVLGYVTKAEIDEEENLWITAELDEDSSTSRDLYRKISKGNANGRKPKLGFSVRGKVTKWHPVYDPEVQKSVPHFDNLLIKEISVTQQPANPTPYPIAIAKSLLNDPENAQALEENMSEQNDTVLHPAQAANNTELTNIEGQAAEEQNEIAADAANVDLQEPNAEQVVDNTNDAAQAQSTEQVSQEAQNDLPAGYVAAPNSVSETQDATTQEAAPAATPEAVADPVVQNLEASLASVTQALEELRGQVEALKAPVETQKAEEVAEPAKPEVADNLDEKIALAVSKAFEAVGLKNLVDEVQVMKSALDEVSKEPVDQSISVSKAKDVDDDNDPMSRFKKLKEQGSDSITAALTAGYPVLRKK